MANEQNLRPVTSHDEAVEKGRAGGIASAKARKQRKLLRDIVNDQLNEPIWLTFPDGSRRRMTLRDAIALAQIRKAIDGDSQAFRNIAMLLGELSDGMASEGGLVINVQTERAAMLLNAIMEKQKGDTVTVADAEEVED